MHLAIGIGIGSCSVGPRKGTKILIKGSILFDHNHNVLDRVGSPPGSLRDTRLRDGTEARKYEKYDEGTNDAGCPGPPETLPEGKRCFLRLFHFSPFKVRNNGPFPCCRQCSYGKNEQGVAYAQEIMLVFARAHCLMETAIFPIIWFPVLSCLFLYARVLVDRKVHELSVTEKKGCVKVMMLAFRSLLPFRVTLLDRSL